MLPIFSVDTEEEAEDLATRTCILAHNGQYVAVALAEAQTLDNLYAFGDRLRVEYAKMKKEQRCQKSSSS